MPCDNEFCTGVYDEHGRDVCELYNEEFNNYIDKEFMLQEDLQEKCCTNCGNQMNFVNEYIYVQELKAKKDFIDQVLKDYDNKVLQVMKSEGSMSVEDYHYLFALKDVRNYLVNQKLGINNLLHEWDTFDTDTLEQVKKYINSFRNDSIDARKENKKLKPNL